MNTPERNVYSQLLSRGSVYAIATAFQISSTLIIVPIVTRILSADSYGQLALALVVVQIGGVFAALGIPGAITRLHFDEGVDIRRTTGLVWISAAIAVPISLGLDATGDSWIVVIGLSEYSDAIRLAVWCIPFMVAARAAQAVFRARGRAGQFVTVAGILSLGANAVGLGMAAGEPSPDTYMLGFLFGCVIAAVVAIALLGARPVADRSLTRTALAVGLPTVAHGLALYALSAGDRVVIQALLGSSAVGRYQSAYLAGALTISLLVGLNNAWAPLIHGAEPEARWSLLAETTGTVVKVAAFLGLGMALVAPVVMRVFVPPEYGRDELADVVAVVAASTVAYATYLAAVHVLFQKKRTLSLMVITPLTAAANIGLNFSLVAWWGLLGAAVATVLSYIALAAAMQLRARRLAPVNWPWPTIARWGVLTFVAVALLVALPNGTFYEIGRAVSGGALGLYLLRDVRSLLGVG